jgi:hypothetical protein
MAKYALTSWGRWLFWAGVTMTCMMAIAYGTSWMVGMTFFPYYQANPQALMITGAAAAVASALFYAMRTYPRFVFVKEAFQERKRQEFMQRSFARPASPEENRRMAEFQTAMAMSGNALMRAVAPVQDDSGTRLYGHRPAVPYIGAASGGSGGIGIAGGAAMGIIGASVVPERPHLVDITERNLADAPPTEDLIERIQADPRPIAPGSTPKKRDRYEMIKV